MRLMSSVLGFVLRKLGLLLALVLSLFLGYLLTQAFIPTLREAVADRDRLQQVAEERAALEEELEQLRSTAAEGQSEAIASLDGKIEAEIEEGRRNFTEKKAEIERLRDDQEEICGFMRDLIDLVTPGNACETARVAVKKADEALDTLEDSLGQAEEDAAVLGDPDLTNQEKLDRLGEGGGQSLVQREIDNKESELGQRKAEEKSLEEAQASGVGWVVNQWARSWKVVGCHRGARTRPARSPAHRQLLPADADGESGAQADPPGRGVRERGCRPSHHRCPANPGHRTRAPVRCCPPARSTYVRCKGRSAAASSTTGPRRSSASRPASTA